MVELLEEVAQVVPGSVGRLMERYQPLVWSIARRQLGVDAAQDVVQEVFIDLWRHAERFDPEKGSEATFVTTFARRRLADHQRKRGRRLDPGELNEEAAQVPDSGDAADASELADEARRARAAIDGLQGGQREVLHLALVEGLTQPRIAEVTGLPLGTVKSHARRGLAWVRASLGLDSKGERIRDAAAGESDRQGEGGER